MEESILDIELINRFGRGLGVARLGTRGRGWMGGAGGVGLVVTNMIFRPVVCGIGCGPGCCGWDVGIWVRGWLLENMASDKVWSDVKKGVGKCIIRWWILKIQVMDEVVGSRHIRESICCSRCIRLNMECLDQGCKCSLALLQEFKMKEGCEMVKIRDGAGM
nr:hypothetical protein [Tanacetum cinerariifolium]